MRRALIIAVLVALLTAACAQARVALLATGTNDVALLDVTTDLVVARPALPGPSRAVAITRDGSRAFAAAGNAVAAFGLGMVPAAPLPGTAAPFAVVTRDLGVPAVGIAVSPGGASVYAAAGQRLFVLDARTLAIRHRVRLHGTARALALSREGALAAVVLTNGRVAMVAVGGPKLLRRVKVKGAAGVAFDAGARAWVSAPRRLYLVRQGARRPEKHPLSLGRSVGGAVAASPDGLTLAVGAAHGGDEGRARRRRLASRAGLSLRSRPGRAGLVARRRTRQGLWWGRDALAREPLPHRRLKSVPLPGTTPLAPPRSPGGGRRAPMRPTRSPARGRRPHRWAGRVTPSPPACVRTRSPRAAMETTRCTASGTRPPSATWWTIPSHGGSGNDHLSGADGNDRADGGTGDDSIHGGPGDDHLDGGAGDDHVSGEAGDDLIVDRPSATTAASGRPRQRHIKGGRGSDLIEGGQGNEQLSASRGPRTSSAATRRPDRRRRRPRHPGGQQRRGQSRGLGRRHGGGRRRLRPARRWLGTRRDFGDDGADMSSAGRGPTIGAGGGDDTIRAATTAATGRLRRWQRNRLRRG